MAANQSTPALSPGENLPDNMGHELLTRHGDALFRFALSRLRSVHAAEDAVQETLLAALAQLARDGFAGRSSELTWLTGILKHKIVDQIRQMARQGRLPNDASEDAQTPSWDEFFDQRGEWKLKPGSWGRLQSQDPHHVMERTEAREILQRCLDAMPPRLSRLFMLREADGIKSDELCKDFGITATNLWALLHRTRTRLRQCLDTHGIANVSDAISRRTPS